MKKKVCYNGDWLVVDSETLDIFHNGKKAASWLNKAVNRHYVSYIGKDGKNKLVPRARIICQAFNPNPDYKRLQTDHINSDQLDDKPSNLRWVTRKFNNSRPHAIDQRKKNWKWTCHDNEVIEATSAETGEVMHFANGIEAAEFMHCSTTLIYITLDEARKLCTPKVVKGWKLEWTTSVKDDVLTEVKAARKAEVNLSNGRLESAVAHATARLKVISKMNKKRRKRLASTRLREGHPRRVATENMLKKMEKRQKTLELEVEAMQKLLKKGSK